MGLQFRQGRDGELRQWWYGSYFRQNGTRAIVNLNVPFEGTPPASGKITDRGDHAFERSRDIAKVKLAAMELEEKKGRQTKAAALRQYLEHTGKALSVAPIADLITARSGEQRKRSASNMRCENYTTRSFVAWAKERNVSTVLDVTLALARQYMDTLYNPAAPTCTARTAQTAKGMLAIAFDRVLPEEASNPFRHPTLKIHTLADDTASHREPLTPEQVERLLVAAAADPEAHDWIVCALSTGLRKGDVCRLRWESVDLRGGTLRLKTNKTKAELYLPVMPLLGKVLARRMEERRADCPFVFPEAEELLRRNETAITRRVKKVFVDALCPATPAQTEAGGYTPLANVFDTVSGATGGLHMGRNKRARMMLVLRLYAADKPYSAIMAETRLSKACISDLLNEAEKASGVRFIRRQRQPGTQTLSELIASVTRTKRAIGKKAASRYDFHALRTTFVTLAISAGVSVDKLRALTGHATVEIVMRHYFKAKGTDFADDLKNALPKVLTDEREKCVIA